MKTVLIALFSFCAAFGTVTYARYAEAEQPVLVAQAPTPDAGTVTIPPMEEPQAATPDAGTTKPSDTLHDPVTEPGAAWDDVKAAKKVGWTAAVFAVLLLLGKLASRAKSIGVFAWLGKGRTAIVVAGALTVAAGCYDVAIQGGSWLSVATAGLLALAMYYETRKAE